MSAKTEKDSLDQKANCFRKKRGGRNRNIRLDFTQDPRSGDRAGRKRHTFRRRETKCYKKNSRNFQRLVAIALEKIDSHAIDSKHRRTLCRTIRRCRLMTGGVFCRLGRLYRAKNHAAHSKRREQRDNDQKRQYLSCHPLMLARRSKRIKIFSLKKNTMVIENIYWGEASC